MPAWRGRFPVCCPDAQLGNETGQAVRRVCCSVSTCSPPTRSRCNAAELSPGRILDELRCCAADAPPARAGGCPHARAPPPGGMAARATSYGGELDASILPRSLYRGAFAVGACVTDSGASQAPGGVRKPWRAAAGPAAAVQARAPARRAGSTRRPCRERWSSRGGRRHPRRARPSRRCSPTSRRSTRTSPSTTSRWPATIPRR